MDDSRQLSSHISQKRERKGKDSRLEDLLEFWGAWRADVISGLSASSRSPITVAIEEYKPHPTSTLIQPKQTRVIQPKIPKYWPQKRMALVNQAIWELPAIYQEMLIHKYEDLWAKHHFMVELRWTADEYNNNLRCARRAIKKHPVIKKLLGRA